jgi:hypothetical protein
VKAIGFIASFRWNLRRKSTYAANCLKGIQARSLFLHDRRIVGKEPKT